MKWRLHIYLVCGKTSASCRSIRHLIYNLMLAHASFETNGLGQHTNDLDSWLMYSRVLPQANTNDHTHIIIEKLWNSPGVS
jgi:hypothetical protein